MATDYDSQAEKWVRNEPKTISDVVVRPRMLEFVKKHGKGKVILDIGCGEGYFARMMVDQTECKRVVGVEISKGMIKLAEKQEREDHKEILYFHESALDMASIPDRTIDICVSNAVANYLKPRELYDFYWEISRVLKKDGKFGVLIPHPRFLLAKDWNGPALHYHPENFDYNLSRGKFFEGMLETLDGDFLKVSCYHSTVEDHLQAMTEVRLTVDKLATPVLTEELAERYPKFKKMQGEIVYLIILGSK